MNVVPIPNSSIQDIPLEQLAHNHTLTDEQKVGVAAQQFEALLLRQILSETQKTVIPSKYADNSTTAGIYHDMVTKQLADSISKSGTLGLAQTLQRQLTRQLHPTSPAGPDCVAAAKPHLPSEAGPVRPTHLKHPNRLKPTALQHS